MDSWMDLLIERAVIALERLADLQRESVELGRETLALLKSSEADD